jgi:hypothetical protein
VAQRRVLVGAALEDALVDQVVEPGGEHVAGDAEAALPVVEAGDAEEGVAHDQQRPPLPHHLECARDRARHVGEGGPAHVTRLTVASRN